MALPEGITTAQVTAGPVFGFDGAACSLEMTVHPSSTLFWADTSASLAPFPMSAPPGSSVTLALPHTDQPGFINEAGAPVAGWFYTAVGAWVHPDPDVARVTFRKRFQILTGQTEVDLDRIGLGPVTPAVVAPTLGVTSLAGLVGPITEAQIRDLLGGVPNTGVIDGGTPESTGTNIVDGGTP